MPSRYSCNRMGATEPCAKRSIRIRGPHGPLSRVKFPAFPMFRQTTPRQPPPRGPRQRAARQQASGAETKRGGQSALTIVLTKSHLGLCRKVDSSQLLSASRWGRSPRAIAPEMVVDRGLSATPQLMNLITRRVATCLRDRRDQGLVENAPTRGWQWLEWRISPQTTTLRLGALRLC